ncbi:hypothetical protein Hte_000702 [Hypoxylon texense]
MANQDVEMTDAGDPASHYQGLIRADSRWRNLPDHDGPPVKPPGDVYDVLIYIRDGTLYTPEKLGQAVFQAASKAEFQSTNYRSNPLGGVMTRGLIGNDDANKIIREMDELIRLGRTVYTSPMALGDWIDTMFAHRYRPSLLHDDVNKAGTLRRVLDWADCWAAVRYRFLNFHLRDHPQHYELMDQKNYTDSGNRANDMVHESSVEGDCTIGGAYWLTKAERSLYKLTYGLRVSEGVRLRTLSTWNELPTSLQRMFEWIIRFINSYINWKEGRIRPRVRMLWNKLDTANVRYGQFIECVKTLIQDAIVQKKIYTQTWQNFTRATAGMRNAVRNSPLNAGDQGVPQAFMDSWPQERFKPHLSNDPIAPPRTDMFSL